MLRFGINRRQFLISSTAVVAAGATMLMKPQTGRTEGKSDAAFPAFNGNTDPFPIPWLDKNGSHNQSPGPGMDPSSIYDFKGRVARANDFKGMGTDNRGNRIAFGAPSTDFSFLQGEYWAARTAQKGIFTHI